MVGLLQSVVVLVRTGGKKTIMAYTLRLEDLTRMQLHGLESKLPSNANRKAAAV